MTSGIAGKDDPARPCGARKRTTQSSKPRRRETSRLAHVWPRNSDDRACGGCGVEKRAATPWFAVDGAASHFVAGGKVPDVPWCSRAPPTFAAGVTFRRLLAVDFAVAAPKQLHQVNCGMFGRVTNDSAMYEFCTTPTAKLAACAKSAAIQTHFVVLLSLIHGRCDRCPNPLTQ